MAPRPDGGPTPGGYHWLVTLATFKDLCIDASDASALGAFWSAALGLDLHRKSNGDACLTGPTRAHTIWINQVPEPKSVKHRIHLDVHGSSIDSLLEIGASVLDAESFPWVIMADPEGGEFCLFLRDTPPAYRLYEVAVDCADHDSSSRWWASVIGGRRSVDERGFSFIEQIPNAPFAAMTFAPVDEAKSTKNRVHIDLVSDDVKSLIDRGATMLRARDDDIEWSVLADPEGNEFCVFASH